MMLLTPKTTISKILWLFLLKKPYHLCLENSILKEVKIAHILKTIQLFDSIFSLMSFSLLSCPLPLKKPQKMLKNTLDYAYHKNLKIRYTKNAKTLITWKPFNFSTQFFFQGSFPLLSYPSQVTNHPKCWKNPSYKERRLGLVCRQTLVQLFRWSNSNFSGRRSIFLRSTLPEKYFGRSLGSKNNSKVTN